MKTLDNFTKIALIIFVSISFLSAQDIEITDYRIPQVKFQRLTGQFSGSWIQQSSDNLYRNYFLNDRDISRLNNTSLNVGGGYVYNRYDEKDFLFLDVGLIGSLNSFNIKYEQYNDSLLSLTKDDGGNKNTNLSFAFESGAYLVPDKWFYALDLTGSHSYRESDFERENINSINSSKERQYYKSNFLSASITGSIGYGKIRDGSVVFTITRVLNKLEEDGILTRCLTKEEMLTLIEITAKRIEYMVSYDRYMKYFLEDFFKELHKMGVLKNDIPTAYSIMRTVEALMETVEPRKFGWQIKIGIQRSISEEISQQTFNPYNKYNWYVQDYLKIVCEYAFPISLNLQFHTSLIANIPKNDFKRKINFNGFSAFTYQLGERIRTGIIYSAYRSHNLTSNLVSEDKFQRNIEQRLGLVFDFYIENQITFNITGSYLNRSVDLYTPGINSKSTFKTPLINFGVIYRLI